MLVKVRVLKELPQGQEPGSIHEFDEAVVRAFMTPGIDAVELYVEPQEPPVRQRGRYRRSDMHAEKTADLVTE